MSQRACLLVTVVLSSALFVFAPESRAQSYSPIQAPKSTTTWYTYCRDGYGNPVPYCILYVYTGAYLYTNSHLHDDLSHPYSTFTFPGDSTPRTSGYGQAGPDGYLYIYLTGTIVGQAEFLCARDTRNGYTSCSNYAVGYNDVYYNDHPEIWIKIGGSDTGGDTGHGTTAYNRYMMSNPAYGLYYATQFYLAEHTGVNQVCTNDMALPFGGKFDISIYSRWRSPHAEHDRGTAADVAGPGSGQCPAANQVIVADFIYECVYQGALSAYSYNEGNHAHCNWANPSTYPH